MRVKILTGMYRGEVGFLVYDDEGFAWITVVMMGMHRDIAANSVTYEEVV